MAIRPSRLLFLAPRYPSPPVRGDQRRVLHLLGGLAEHAEVTLVTFGTGDDLGLARVRTRAVARGAMDIVAGNVTHLDPRLPLQVRLFLSGALQRIVAEELAREPAVVHLTLSRLGPYLPPPGPWHRHVDLIDALSLNMATRARASSGPARWPFAAEARLLGRYEAELIRRADSSSLVGEDDRRGAPGLERAVVIPNGVDTEAFEFRPPEHRPPILLFFGNLGYFHNVAPAQFVAREVLPRVRARVERATLRVAGARPAGGVRSLSATPGVSVVGQVAQMSDELHGAAVAIVPMFSGTGIKNKVLESFSAGTPVVSNELGMAGVEGAVPGRHFLRGETADELAAACVALLEDAGRGMELARNARTLVQERYSWDRQVRALLALYGDRL